MTVDVRWDEDPSIAASSEMVLLFDDGVTLDDTEDCHLVDRDLVEVPAQWSARR